MKTAHVCCQLTTLFACAILLVWVASANAGATAPTTDSGAKYHPSGERGDDIGRVGAFRAPNDISPVIQWRRIFMQ